LSGDLDVDDPRLWMNDTSQSLHHCYVRYKPMRTQLELDKKDNSCKCNWEHKHEQEDAI
jgi:hypothetical protein